jgi:Protein of unknown function (DUF3592)
MAGFFLFDAVMRGVRGRARRKRVARAAQWPQTRAEVNGWKVVEAEGGTEGSFADAQQIEASFYFVLNGEFYGGYLRSVPMTRREAERLGVGSPVVQVRYNPANPDEVVVLAGDNTGELGFGIVSG